VSHEKPKPSVQLFMRRSFGFIFWSWFYFSRPTNTNRGIGGKKKRKKSCTLHFGSSFWFF